MKLIVDADPLVYRAGFGVEQKYYHGVVEHPDGTLEEFYKKAGQEMREYEQNMELLPGGCHRLIHKEAKVIVEPVSHALQLVRHQIQGIEGALMERGTPVNSLKVVLTGPGNFREKLATLRPYKGNRDPEHKPVHYQAIRDYLVNVYSARVIHGREADDEVSIVAHQELAEGHPYCVATIDKDLDQVPGLHYDYRQHVFYTITPEDARFAFWTQALSGDIGDNVPGCYKLGPARAQRLVNKWFADGLSESEIWTNVVDEYRASQRKAGCPYRDRDAYEVAVETARLVYMLHKAGELWTPPGEETQTQGTNLDD